MEEMNNQQQEKDYILEVDGLKQYFPVATNFFGKPTAYLRAVDGVSFKIERGKTLGVVGESGCGKTTLGRTILRLYDVTEGSALYTTVNEKGEKVTHDLAKISKKEFYDLRTELQLVFQDPYSSLPPRMTVGAIIGEAVKVHKIVPDSEISNYVRGVMARCGLQPHHYDRYPHEFSGGQRQRICIARALAVKPKFVICDEPVSALDVSIQAQIINLLKELQRSLGLTYLFISHDLSVMRFICDRIAVIHKGKLVELCETEKLFRHPLHPYTRALLSAVPQPDPDSEKTKVLTTYDPSMHDYSVDKPEWIEIEPEHFVLGNQKELDEYRKILSE